MGPNDLPVNSSGDPDKQAGGTPGAWLLFLYSAPTEPSAVRVAAWRALKELGAVKLADGSYALPHTDALRSALADVRERIQQGGGSAIIVAASGCDHADENSLREAFQAARDDEFRQVVRNALRLVEHIGRVQAEDDYRFAEVDALEEELEKVRRQFQRATRRDLLGTASRRDAAQALSEADDRLRRYLNEAFRRENGLPPR